MSDKTLDERMKAAGMSPLSELLACQGPLEHFQTNVGVVDMESFEEWLAKRYESFLRMQVDYELGDRDREDDLFEWVLGHAGAFKEVLVNFRAAKRRETENG